MLTKLRKESKGFTIIEVLIVLAIAALIILIVFLAVPALQRNSRNTSRRSDVAKLLSLTSEYSANNNGNLPTHASCFGNMVLDTGANTANVSVEGAYYCKAGNNGLSWSNTITTNNTDQNTVVLRSGVVCSGSDATTSGANSRNVVALYTLEQNVKQCQAS